MANEPIETTVTAKTRTVKEKSSSAVSKETKEVKESKEKDITTVIEEPLKVEKKEEKVSLSSKDKVLQTALKDIEKKFGKSALIRLGDSKMEKTGSIGTGSIGLDLALGIGGLPEGRVVEIYGPESSGKTTLALHSIAEAQKKGYRCAFIDAEHAIDVYYAKNLGVDIDNLFLSQPDYGEQALDIIETLSKSGAFDMIVVDSVAALVPKAEIEGDIEDQQIGIHARLMSKSLRRLVSVLHDMKVMVIFINQLRSKIGMIGFGGSNETTTGGHALKFYASVRLDIRRIATLKQGEKPIGNRVKVKVVKNKVAPPFKLAEFDIIFGKGVSRSGEVIDYGVKYEVITKAGTSYSYNDKKLAGVGRESVKKHLEANPELFKEIEAKVLSKLDPASADFSYVADTNEDNDDSLGDGEE
jgi:recombination protein RecA